MNVWIKIVVVVFLLFPVKVMSAPGGNALVISCDEETSNFLVTNAKYYFGVDASSNSESYFVISTSKEQNEVPLLVASCKLNGVTTTLMRTYINTPRSYDMCGAADWGEFKVFRDDVLVASFVVGCIGDSFLHASKFGMSLCILAMFGGENTGCKYLVWSQTQKNSFRPLSITRDGKWR